MLTGNKQKLSAIIKGPRSKSSYYVHFDNSKAKVENELFMRYKILIKLITTQQRAFTVRDHSSLL